MERNFDRNRRTSSAEEQHDGVVGANERNLHVSAFTQPDYSHKLGKRFPVCCIFCESSMDVYLRMDPNGVAGISRSIADYMDKQINKASAMQFSKTPRSPCLAKYEQDPTSSWHRGLILESYGNGLYKVYLVDHGRTLRLREDDIRYCPPLLQTIPPAGATKVAISGAAGNESFEQRKELKKFLENKIFIAEIDALRVSINGKSRMLVSLSRFEDNAPLRSQILEILKCPEKNVRHGHSVAEGRRDRTNETVRQHHTMKAVVTPAAAATTKPRTMESEDQKSSEHAKLVLNEREILWLHKEIQWKEEKFQLEKQVICLKAENQKNKDRILELCREAKFREAELRLFKGRNQQASEGKPAQATTEGCDIKQEYDLNELKASFGSYSFGNYATNSNNNDIQPEPPKLPDTTANSRKDIGRCAVPEPEHPKSTPETKTRNSNHDNGRGLEKAVPSSAACDRKIDRTFLGRMGYKRKANSQRRANIPKNSEKRFRPYHGKPETNMAPCWACEETKLPGIAFHDLLDCPSIRLWEKPDGTKLCFRCKGEHKLHSCPNK